MPVDVDAGESASASPKFRIASSITIATIGAARPQRIAAFVGFPSEAVARHAAASKIFENAAARRLFSRSAHSSTFLVWSVLRFKSEYTTRPIKSLRIA